MMSTALEYDGDRIRVHFDRIHDKVMAPKHKGIIRDVLQWYRDEHPAWFGWLDLA